MSNNYLLTDDGPVGCETVTSEGGMILRSPCPLMRTRRRVLHNLRRETSQG